MKRWCPRCRELKVSEAFSSEKQQWCQACRHDYYVTNRDRLRAYQKAYFESHRRAHLAGMRKRYRTDPQFRAEQKARCRAWREAHRERVRELSRAWFKERWAPTPPSASDVALRSERGTPAGRRAAHDRQPD